MFLKKGYLHTVVFSFLFLFFHTLQAQSVTMDSLLKRVLSTDEFLPMLIDSALKNSPEYRRATNSESIEKANYQISKNVIFDALSLQSSYNYGTNFFSSNNTSLTPGFANLTKAQNGNYTVGIGLQLPISQIINRKNILKLGQSRLNMANAEQEMVVLNIKQQVIQLYLDFKLIHKLMAISSKNKEAAQINNLMAEKDFLNGQINVEQASVVLGVYNKSVVEYETYVNKFQNSYLQLEAFTGTTISSLLMQFK
jgi:outer membrane protein TolC